MAAQGVGEKELAVEYIRPGEIYREPGVDLQLPTSHLAFRLPVGFTGRLAANETFKIFSVDRELSCFVFIHGPDAPLLANWMRAEFTIDGEKLVAAGSGQALLTREFPFARPLPVRA